MKMGIGQNEAVRVKAEYLSTMGWYLDCYTGLIKNILIYLELVIKGILRTTRRGRPRQRQS